MYSALFIFLNICVSTYVGCDTKLGGLNYPVNDQVNDAISDGYSVLEQREKSVNEFDDDALAELESTKQRYEFKAEVNRVMDVFINFLYSKKEIALRELISNAADALEKVRHNAMTNSSSDENLSYLSVKIDYDPELKTISVCDNGIGMTREELENNLGVMAKSGTINFLENVGKGGDPNLIGQFGVGFYAVFLIADSVTVVSKSESDDNEYVWTSTADRGYTIARDPRGNVLGRGTCVSMKLKADALYLLERQELSSIVTKYSQFVPYPIYLRSTKTVSKAKSDSESSVDDSSVDKSESETTSEEPVEQEDEEDSQDKQDKGRQVSESGKAESKSETIDVWEQLNNVKAVWMRKPEDVTHEEYVSFYQTISKTEDGPLSLIHFRGEGEIEFNSILYLPPRAPSDMFENYFNNNGGIKLYARRVLVSESVEDFVPKYLQFVVGMVDSDDLPLNVSREHLQQHKTLKIISRKLQRKIFEMINKLMKKRTQERQDYREKLEKEEREKDEDYDNNEKSKTKVEEKVSKFKTGFDSFYNEFGKSLKLGCYDDDLNRSKIVKFFKFYTSESPTVQQDFDEYVENLPENSSIYYAAGDNISQLMSNPQMQVFLHKQIPVLLLNEAMDEPCIQKLGEYRGRKFESIQKGSIDLPQTEEEKKVEKRLEVAYKPLMDAVKNILGHRVMRVELSRRLVDSPCTVTSSKWGHSAYMERVIKSQTFSDPEQLRFMQNQRILELNPRHGLIFGLRDKLDKSGEVGIRKSVVDMYYAATLASGYDLESPTDFGKRLLEILAEKDNFESALVDIDVEALASEVEDKNSSADLPESKEAKLDSPVGETPDMSDIESKLESLKTLQGKMPNLDDMDSLGGDWKEKLANLKDKMPNLDDFKGKMPDLENLSKEMPDMESLKKMMESFKGESENSDEL